MQQLKILLLFYSFLLFSCSGDKPDILTFELHRSDFVERIYVPGTVQAVVNYPIVAPRNNYGQMTVASIVEDGSFVKKGDTICVLSSANLATSYESLVIALENAEAEVSKLMADNAMNMAALKAQLETSNAQMMISSLDSVQMKFAAPVKQKLLALEMKKTMIEKQKLEKKIKAQKIIDDSEIRQSKSRIMQQQMQLQIMEEQIKSLTIISPRDGLVIQSESPLMMFMSTSGSGSIGGKINKGSNIFPNMALLQFPDLSRMQISAQVSETDYKRIEKGQKVYISIDAIKGLKTTGPVNRKTLVGKTPMQTMQAQSKVKTYEVIINVDSCHSKMAPGLSATCEIVIDEVIDTLAVPTLAIFERDSMKVVYVSEGDKFVAVPVETGKSNSSITLITKGLKGNEIIALSEPSHNMLKKKSGLPPEKEIQKDAGKGINRNDSLKPAQKKK